MQICKFDPQKPYKQATDVIKNLFFTQKIRNFKVEKPIPTIQLTKKSSEIPQLNMSKSTSFVQLNDKYQKIDDIIFNSPKNEIKTKIIKKLKESSINRSYQTKVQKIHAKYLLNHMHKTNQINIKRRIPPDLSVLQTIDEGDYEYIQDIKDIKNPPKREFPHACNVLPVTKIPKQTPNIRIYLTPLKIAMGKDKIFSVDDASVMKIKTILKFVVNVFKMDSGQFEPIAEKIGTSTKNCKLLFDMLNDFYRIERHLQKISEPRNKAMRKIRKKVKKAISKFQSPLQSMYVPKEEHYVSIREIRKLLRNSSKEQDSQ